MNPVTGSTFTIDEYADKVREVGDELCGQLVADNSWDLDLCSLDSSSSSMLDESYSSLMMDTFYHSILSQ